MNVAFHANKMDQMQIVREFIIIHELHCGEANSLKKPLKK